MHTTNERPSEFYLISAARLKRAREARLTTLQRIAAELDDLVEHSPVPDETVALVRQARRKLTEAIVAAHTSAGGTR